ncbi:hypothetical protein [Actinomadura harenae]|nr:hypothetical protein [Actinomadura harenae]
MVREAAPLEDTVSAVVVLVDRSLVGSLGLSSRDAKRLVAAVDGLALDVEALHLRGHTITDTCPVACLRLSEGARRVVTKAGERHAASLEYETRRPALRQVGTVGEVRHLLQARFVARGSAEMAELVTAVGAVQDARQRTASADKSQERRLSPSTSTESGGQT